MSRDAFAAQRSRQRGATPGSAFMQDVPRYAGTDEDYEKSHAQRYGREERLGPDGKHHHGSYQFPRGSDRQKMHTQYSKSTRPRDNSRTAYNNGLAAAERDVNRLDEEDREYYRDYTGGLPPYQHERLNPHAKAYRDDCLRNAENRKGFLKEHPYGYHSAHDQNKHRDYASNAYNEYEFARERQQHHEKYRTYSNLAPKRR